MKKLILPLLATFCLCFSGCSSDSTPQSTNTPTVPTPTPTPTPEVSTIPTNMPVVNVCSWGEYIDKDLITQFTEETGIYVNYQTAESNEALYHLLQNSTVNFDVVIPSDYMISQLIEENKLAPINFDNVPNHTLIGAQFKYQPFDPNNEYTVPYAWGTLGMIYDSTAISQEIHSWDAMFDTDYHGDVLMIRNSRDAFGIALMSLGYSVNTTNPNEIKEAQERIAQAKKDGVYQSFVMDEVYQKMEIGSASLATYYAGDYLSMREANEDLVYVVPETGSNWFIDAMCILETGENKEEAEAWINFMTSTPASLANMDYIWYASPNVDALQQYPYYYEDLYGEPLDLELFEIMAPSQEVLDHCEGYLVLPAETRALYDSLWLELAI